MGPLNSRTANKFRRQRVNGVNINSLQNIAAVFNYLILTLADNVTNNNISNTTDNNTIIINNDTFTNFTSQSFTTKYPYMNSKLTTTKELENINKLLKSKNSQGYDEISTKMLNVSSPYISLSLIIYAVKLCL